MGYLTSKFLDKYQSFFLVLEGLLSPEITEPNQMFLIYSCMFLYIYIYISILEIRDSDGKLGPRCGGSPVSTVDPGWNHGLFVKLRKDPLWPVWLGTWRAFFLWCLFLQLLEASEFKSSVGILMVDIQVTYRMPFCKPTKPWNITLFIAFHSYIIELNGPWNITCDDNPGHVLLWTVGPRVDHLCIQDLESKNCFGNSTHFNTMAMDVLSQILG